MSSFTSFSLKSCFCFNTERIATLQLRVTELGKDLEEKDKIMAELMMKLKNLKDKAAEHIKLVGELKSKIDEAWDIEDKIPEATMDAVAKVTNSMRNHCVEQRLF